MCTCVFWFVPKSIYQDLGLQFDQLDFFSTCIAVLSGEWNGNSVQIVLYMRMPTWSVLLYALGNLLHDAGGEGLIYHHARIA